MTLQQVTPINPVIDLKKSIDFYREVLGFTVGFESPDYAYLHREGVGMRLVKAAPEFNSQDTRCESSCYIDVDDVDQLYAELKPRLEAFPAGRVRAPFDQDYGQREFHVIDEGAMLIFFGQAIQN